jgi:DNA polymerase III delta subunit
MSASPPRRPSAPIPASAFPEALRAGDLPAVVVLAGSERWFRDQAVRAVVAKALPEGDPGGSVLRVDARLPEDRNRVAGVLEELRATSLFGPGRVVVVENPEAASRPAAAGEEDDEGAAGEAEEATPTKRGRSPITELVAGATAAPIAGSVLVLSTSKGVKGKGAVSTEALLKKGAVVVDCRALYDAPAPWERGGAEHDHELSRFVARRMHAEHGKKLSVADAHALARLVGNDLSELDGALRTLSLYAGAKPQVDAADVHAALGVTREDPVWRLVDSVLEGDVDRALSLAEGAFDRGLTDARGAVSSRPEALYATIVPALHSSWRRRLAGAEALARGEPGEEVARASGVPPFLAGTFLERCKRDPADLLRRHRAFLDAETGVKGGGVPPRLALERLVIALAGPPADVPTAS